MQAVKTKIVMGMMTLVLLASCSRDLSSDTYKDSSTVGLVLEGTIVSQRTVKLVGKDRLQDNGTGMLAGGVAGGVAGSTVGGGKGSALAAVGGAIAGAVIGSFAESELSKSEGIEYIVKVKKDNLASNTKSDKVDVNFNSSVGTKIKSSIDTDMKTEMIAIVQGKDVVLSVGQKVYVIYSDDRPRLVPIQ